MTTIAAAWRQTDRTTVAVAAGLLLLALAVTEAALLAGPVYMMVAAAAVLATIPAVWAISSPRRALPLYAFALPLDIYLSTELRLTTTQVLQVGIVAAWAVRLLLTEGRPAGPRRRGSMGPTVRVGLALIVYLIVSLTWAINPEVSARSVVRNLGAIMMAVYVAYHADRDLLGRITRAACYGALVTTVYGFAQYAQGGYDALYPLFSPFYNEPFLSRGHGFAVVATFANPNILAGYMLMVLPIGWASVVAARGTRRAAWLVAVLMMGGVLLLTFSKGSWILLGILAVAWFFARLPGGGALMLAVAGGAALGVVLLFLDPIMNTLIALFPNSQEGSVDVRLSLWSAALSAFIERPLLGFGLDGFAAATAGVRYGALADLVRAHNMYLQALVDLGVVGSVLWWTPCLLIVRRGLLQLRRADHGPEASLHLALLLGAAAYFLYGMVETLNISNQYVNTSWLVIGLLAASNRLRADELRRGSAA